MKDFFAALYEGFSPLDLFYIQDFSRDMYDTEAYVTIGLIMIISSLILEAIYYYTVSNFGNMFKRRYWFLWLLMIAALNFIFAYYHSVVEIENLYMETGAEPSYTFSEYFTFSLVNVLWTLIFSFLFSLIFKIKSVQASRTPF